jgi:hypothetical protein
LIIQKKKYILKGHMIKRIPLFLVLLLFCLEFAWAQRAAQEDDRAARRQWEEDQRADEYANSLRRRDWLKDRLILELGMGTKFPAMGANWFGFGAGVEYITRWHASAFLSAGFIPASEDPTYPDLYNLDGGMGWRIGLAYYLFPKNPIHLSFQVSYGTVFYDHEVEPRELDEKGGGVRKIILCNGYEFDVVVSYLSDQWYFLQAMVGVYTIGNGDKDGGNSWGRSNDSWSFVYDEDKQSNIYKSLVVKDGKKDEDGSDANSIPPVGIVFGIGIGFAFEEFFPDDTELRRREREGGRVKQSQFRSSTPAKSAKPAPKKNTKTKVVEEDDEED